MAESNRMLAIARSALLIGVALSACAGCDSSAAAKGPADEATKPTLRAAVTIPPLAYLLERVGGDRVEVMTLVPEGQDAHTYSPSPRQVAELAQADVLFAVGVETEQRILPKLRQNQPDLPIIETQNGLELRLAKPGEACHADHDHGAHDHDTAEGKPDPHVWLSLPNAIKIAERMRNELTALDPEHAAGYKERTTQLAGELGALHARLTDRLAPLRGEAFLVFHPAYGYFGDSYGLEQVSIEVEGKAPTPRQVIDVIERARRDHLRLVFYQPQFSASAADLIAREVGGVAIAIDPLSHDFVAQMQTMADQLASQIASAKP